MKRLSTTKTALAAVGLALMLLAAPAGAQTPVLRFDVPFAFTAGSQDFAPGQYWINVNIERMQMVVTSPTSTSTAIVHLAQGGAERSPAKAGDGMLRFQKWGNRYFLVGVWRAGSIEGDGIALSSSLVESAKAEAGSETTATYVDLR